MAIAKKCDRCGKCDVYASRDFFGLQLRSNNLFGSLEHDYDLCRDCKEEFDKFMKGGEKE